MEFMTVTAILEGRRYIAIYRKSFNEKLGAWEMEMVPGTLRWIN
jgi:CTP-dependent riboflavin kinase